MKYDPAMHHRRSIRLKGYDYSLDGAYFITICTHNWKPYFDQYNELRQIVTLRLQDIPDRFVGVMLDEFAIMPNHIHAIIIVGATLAVALTVRNNGAGAQDNGTGARSAPTVGAVVGVFK